MKNVLFVQDFDAYKKGDHAAVDDQIACDAIANGFAVPSVEPVQQPSVLTEQVSTEAA
jgi:hypothetical protein